MNNEIKEILDIIKKVSKAEENSYNGLIETPPMKWGILLDYITNLKEENERLKTNWQVAQEDLEHILKLLGLELGDTIYDIENKILELQGENERLNNIINETLEYAKYQLENLDFYKDTKARMLCSMGIVLLQGEDNDED